MNIGKTLAAATVLSVLGVTSASAATLLVAVVEGNDPFPDPLFVEQYDLESPALAKCDTGTDNVNFPSECDDWKDGHADGFYDSAFSLTYADANSFSWTFDPDLVTGLTDSDDVLYPRFVVVKQTNNYEIWELSMGEVLGGTIDSERNDISHVSFYDSMTPIPLPAAGWLLLGGLAGLYGMKRRKKAS